MKTLIVYYSLTGNTQFIAEKIAEAIHADILAVQPKDAIDLKGVKKYLWLGRQVFMKEEPELLPLDKNPNDYDLIIFGSPVWGWTFVPALRTLFSNITLKNKKIALFCCHGGGKGGIFKKMKEALGDNNYIGEIDFYEPLKKDTEEKVNKAIEWAKSLMKR